MLGRLIYKSRSLCTPLAALDICRSAARANAGLGVTGALCVQDGIFLQYLEGDELALSELYSAIQLDARHTACEVLDRRRISTRVFRNWGMAWLPVDADTALIIQAISASNVGFAEMDGATAGAMFRALSHAVEHQ